MAMERFAIFTVLVAALISAAYAIPGTATYYTQYVPSACYGDEDQGLMIAAANPCLYNNGAGCGTRYTITCTETTTEGIPQLCTGDNMLVMVVDLCLGCEEGQFDLSLEAFEMIAVPDAAGRIFIDYNQA